MGNRYKSVLEAGGVQPTGNALPADVLDGKTFSNADGTDKVGTMTNNGAVSPTALDPAGSYTIPEGYHDGNGVVSAKSNTATYTASARGAALDMGASNLNRYVDTSGVPNANSGTYTFPANDTGGTKDLGETNSYRYVNAQNVYNKGKADGSGFRGMWCRQDQTYYPTTYTTNAARDVVISVGDFTHLTVGANGWTYYCVNKSTGATTTQTFAAGTYDISSYGMIFATGFGVTQTLTLS